MAQKSFNTLKSMMDEEISESEPSEIVSIFLKYGKQLSEVYHSPNTSPSSPTINGIVSE